MKKQILNNGCVLVEEGNLVHLHNKMGIAMVFTVVDIDPAGRHLVLEANDFKKFDGDLVAIHRFITGKPIVKGLIEYGNRIK